MRTRLQRAPALRSVALGSAWAAATAWVALRLNQGWVPHDDGSFAQSALRVLDGELPHREFAELYSGGLTFLNAGVFRVLGDDLIWLRVPVLILFLGYVPCCYAIARRFVAAPHALLATAFAVVWSVPVYPAAVPSWYLLFFSVFGAYCVIRYFETERSKWLFAAGLFGGLEIGFKIVGIWFVVAVIAGLVASEQASHPRSERGRALLDGYRVFVSAGALAAVALVLSVLGPHLGGAEVVNLLLPVVSLCSLPFVAEHALGEVPARDRFRSLGRRIVPFMAGVAIPVGLVALPYVIAGAVPDLIDGVFVAPRSRLDYSYISTPGAASVLWGLPVLAAFVARRHGPWLRRAVDTTAVIAMAGLLVTAGASRSYLVLWHTTRALAPLLIVVGALMLARRPAIGGSPPRRLALHLLLLVAGFGSLVQFPFGAPVYFCYAAPLFGLAAVALIASTGRPEGLLPVAVLAAGVLFGIFYLDRAPLSTLGIGFQADPQTVILDDERASIRVTPEDRATYRRAAGLLERHSRGQFVFAGPDAPELYVLSRRKNPTRSLFDFVDTSDSARGERLLQALRGHGVSAIAINRDPDFSDPLDATTVRRLAALYPTHVRVGRFDVRWR